MERAKTIVGLAICELAVGLRRARQAKLRLDPRQGAQIAMPFGSGQGGLHGLVR